MHLADVVAQIDDERVCARISRGGVQAPRFFEPPLRPDDPAYWGLMQLGMAIGFLTSYPMNWWLLRRGLKERM